MNPPEPTLTPRMQVLLDAAVEVLAAQGLRGLTHRAVDAQAGLPIGSCSAYLRTRQALLTALASYVVGQVRRDIAELGSRLDEEPNIEQAALETASMFSEWLRQPALLLARLELGLEAIRSPELAAEFAQQRAALATVVTDLVARRRPEQAAEMADILIAALDGVLIEAFRKPAQSRVDYIERSLRALLDVVVGGDPAVEI